MPHLSSVRTRRATSREVSANLLPTPQRPATSASAAVTQIRSTPLKTPFVFPSPPEVCGNSPGLQGHLSGQLEIALRVDLRYIGLAVAKHRLRGLQAKPLPNFRSRRMSQPIRPPVPK